MAFVAEGMGDYSNASFYLAKYYDQNPNPRVITKIKVLTEQSNLFGYELDDSDRFLKFLTDLQDDRRMLQPTETEECILCLS
jgi:hypothetical protein